jgi:hypothetical protein
MRYYWPLALAMEEPDFAMAALFLWGRVLIRFDA